MTGRSRLRIAQVVCTDEFAGVERYVVTLSRELARRGHDVVVLGGHPSRMPAELAGTSVHWEPAASTAIATRRLLNCRGIDLVHAHMTAGETAAVVAKPLHRAAIVSTRHFAKRRGSHPASRVWGRVVGRVLTAQIAISEYVAEHVEGSCTVVLTGVEATPSSPAPREREHAVLLVSRLEAEKRVDIALRVWHRSGLAEQGWQFLVAGNGSQRGALERLAAELGIAHSCRFLGARDDVPSLLDSAGILVAPCPIEAFGLAVVEAMAHAVPVVAVVQGAHAEILGRARGAALFDRDDVDEGARLLARLAHRDDIRESYGNELRIIQQRDFTLDRQVEQTLAVYRSAVG